MNKIKNVVTYDNYTQKMEELNELVKELNIFIHKVATENADGLPQGIPSTVNGIAGIRQILNCGYNKALNIMSNPKYQTAFFGEKGARNRLCDTRKLLTLMRNDNARV